MEEKEFRKLVKKNLYQVFLFSCPAPIPTNFALHYWFVVNNKGKLSRWDLLVKPSQVKTSWRYLHKTNKDFSLGLNKYHFKLYPRSKSKFHRLISGKKGSLAEKIVKFIEKSPKNYPYCEKYHLLGPNSNTYIQWIINKFPESGFKLGWRAFGKNYNIKPKGI